MGAVACVKAAGVCSRDAAADRSVQGARELAALVPAFLVPAQRWTGKARTGKTRTVVVLTVSGRSEMGCRKPGGGRSSPWGILLGDC